MQVHVISLPVLFVQPVIIVVLALLFLELISWIFLADSPKKILKRIRGLTRVGRWGITSGLLWLAIIIVAIWDLHNTSPISFTLLSTGLVIFLLGWWERYRPLWLKLAWKHAKKLRPLLARIEPRSSFFNVRHPEHLGAWLEATGVSVSAISPIAFFPSLFLLPLILWRAIFIQEQHIDEERREWIRRDVPHALVPSKLNILRLASIPVVLGFLVGISIRELTLFNGGIESARSILTMLTQVEGTLGVLAITIIFVLAQLAAASFSTRTSAVLVRRWAFWIPLVILLVSVTYNILMISRLDVFFQPGIIYENVLIDLSLILGALTVFSIAFFIWRAPRLVSPEAIIADALRHFDSKWMDVIRGDWERPVRQLKLRVEQDPLVVVERVLAKSVESGDNLSFTSGLVLLRERFWGIVRPEDLIEFDAYLHHHLRSVVRMAAKYSDSHSLEQLTQFVRELGAPSPEAIIDTKMIGWEAPAGEMLVREIIDEALAQRLEEPLTLGLVVVEERSENVLRTLPPGDATWMYNPRREEIRLSDNKTFSDNDLRIRAFEDQYLRYLGRIAESAIELGLREIGWAASYRLTNIMLQIQQYAKGLQLKQMLLHECGFHLSLISQAACRAKLARVIDLGMLQYLAQELDTDEEEGTAWLLVNQVKTILLDQARVGILDFGMVIDVAMLGLKIVEKFTEPAVQLIGVMGEAAKCLKSLPNFGDNRELQSTYGQLISRIRQQVNVKSYNREKIAATVKSTLEELGEPEFEER